MDVDFNLNTVYVCMKISMNTKEIIKNQKNPSFQYILRDEFSAIQAIFKAIFLRQTLPL